MKATIASYHGFPGGPGLIKLTFDAKMSPEEYAKLRQYWETNRPVEISFPIDGEFDLSEIERKVASTDE